jgi:phenylacetate-CoA ligase
MLYQPKFEALSREELGRLQGRRLEDLLGRLAECSAPYWREKMDGVVPTSDIAAISSLPFTIKDEYRQTFPYGMLAVPLRDVVRVHASSGTSGRPTIVGYTRSDISVFADVNARALACAGGTEDDIVHVAYGYGLFTGGLGLHYGVEALGATTVPASGGNVGFQISLMADLGATGLAATPSFSLLLAEAARAEGIIDRIPLRWGILGAEPWSEEFRQKLEEAWGGGFTARDIYGLSEVVGPGVAAECVENPGGLHVQEDHFYPEIVDPETGEAVAEGEEGELVLTTLTRIAQPVLRYRTRDVTRFLPGSCPCGRTSRRIARIAGRVDDMLIIRGVNVYPRSVESTLLADPRVGAQYALIVDRRGTMTELGARVELADGVDVSEADSVRADLAQALTRVARIRIDVDVRPSGSLPRMETGKAKRVFERVDDSDPLESR